MMTPLNKDRILERLQKHWDCAVHEGINPEYIVGVFLFGSQNYGFGTDESDIDTNIIVIPSFKNFCLEPELISKTCKIQRGDTYEYANIKDIRLIREMFMKQNINFMEILFTDYYILNPRYEAIFKHYFINQREAISHYDRERTFKSISGQAIHSLHENAVDNKKIYNAERLYIFLREYLLNKPYEECMKPTGKEWTFLWQLKNHQSEFSRDSSAKLEYSDKLLKNFRKLEDLNISLSSPLQKEAQRTLDEGVMELIKTSFSELFESSAISRATFLKSLTKNEETAYYYLIDYIHEEGCVNMTQFIKDAPFSRQTFTVLMNKMKDYQVAEIKSQGKKGTYVRITQPELRNEALEYSYKEKLK